MGGTQNRVGKRREAEQDREERRPLPTKIAVQLIREIVAGKFKPGEWLREQDISDRFEVSRAPVREALRFLEQAGFVEMFPWRGAKITAPSKAETEHIFELLEAIYGIIARIAAETMPEEAFGELDARMVEARKALATPELRDDRIRIAHEIAISVARGASSRTAYRAFIHIGTLSMWQHRFVDPNDLELATRSADLHYAMIEAIKRRDGRTAQLLAGSIIGVTREAVIPYIGD